MRVEEGLEEEEEYTKGCPYEVVHFDVFEEASGVKVAARFNE